MYITGAPTIECESTDVYGYCAHFKKLVQGCISLVCPLYDISPRRYITGTPAVGCESRDVYRWCAHCRMQVQDVYRWCANCRMRVQECILLVHPP